MDTKPCPFCASPKNRIDYDSVVSGKPPMYVWVICENCGACGPSDLGKSGAIEMWNLRRTVFQNTTESVGTNPQS